MKKVTFNNKAGVWSEGEHMDLWSLVHLLGGGVLAGWLFLLNFKTWPLLITSFTILLVWEITEILIGIKEHKTNIFWDILIGFAGSILIWYLMNSKILNNISIFIIITIVFVILDVLGYLAYVKRKK